jgi:hypothetical protein
MLFLITIVYGHLQNNWLLTSYMHSYICSLQENIAENHFLEVPFRTVVIFVWMILSDSSKWTWRFSVLGTWKSHGDKSGEYIWCSILMLVFFGPKLIYRQFCFREVPGHDANSLTWTLLNALAQCFRTHNL